MRNYIILLVQLLFLFPGSAISTQALASEVTECPVFVTSDTKYNLAEAQACEERGNYFSAGWIYDQLRNCEKVTENYLKSKSASGYTNLIISSMYSGNTCYDPNNWRNDVEKYFSEALSLYPYNTGLLERRGTYEKLIYSYDSYRWFLKAFLSEPYGEWEKNRQSDARSKLYDSNKYSLVPVLTQELKKDFNIWKKGNSESKNTVRDWIIEDLDPEDSFMDLEYLGKVIDWPKSQLHYLKGQQYLSGQYEFYDPQNAYVHFLLSGKLGLYQGAKSARNLAKSLDKSEIKQATCLADFNPEGTANFLLRWYCRD